MMNGNPMGYPPGQEPQITVHQAIPAKVCVAFDYIKFTDAVMNPPTCATHGVPMCEPRQLSKKEVVVYDSALEVLRLYFSGEHDFGPKHIPLMPFPPFMMQQPPPDDDPGVTAPIEVK